MLSNYVCKASYVNNNAVLISNYCWCCWNKEKKNKLCVIFAFFNCVKQIQVNCKQQYFTRYEHGSVRRSSGTTQILYKYKYQEHNFKTWWGNITHTTCTFRQIVNFIARLVHNSSENVGYRLNYFIKRQGKCSACEHVREILPFRTYQDKF